MIDRWMLKNIEIEVEAELIDATVKHGSFRSAHEGYAVIKEEVDELWDEIKRRVRSDEAMWKEAVQIAAMAIRFLYDLRDTRLHASAESESAHSAGQEPPATQRTSPSEDRPSLVAVPRQEWPAVASPTEAQGPYSVDRESEYRKLDPGDEGLEGQSADRQPLKLWLDRKTEEHIQRLRHPVLLGQPKE